MPAQHCLESHLDFPHHPDAAIWRGAGELTGGRQLVEELQCLLPSTIPYHGAHGSIVRNLFTLLSGDAILISVSVLSYDPFSS